MPKGKMSIPFSMNHSIKGQFKGRKAFGGFGRSCLLLGCGYDILGAMPPAGLTCHQACMAR